jgi:hypothetical protein
MYGRIASNSEVELPCAAASASRTISDLLRLDAAEMASRRENSGFESFTVIVGMLRTVLPSSRKAIRPTRRQMRVSDRARAEFSKDAIDHHRQAAGCLLGKTPPVYWRLCLPLMKSRNSRWTCLMISEPFLQLICSNHFHPFFTT